MHTENVKVDICIATYKRVAWLEKLLASLVAQELDRNIDIRLIIIDNDPEQSAREMVSRFFLDKNVRHIYDVQPEKNISLTRNKALDFVDADYAAFIDDDEWAEANWLSELLSACHRYDADVVFGLVSPRFVEQPSDWVVNGGFFNRALDKTGDLKQDGGAGNVLLRLKNGKLSKFRFRSEFGKTGGEDTDFFYRLYRNGFKLIWCNEAIAYEAVPVERLTIKWLVMRAFRGGQNFALIRLEYLSLYGKAGLVVRRLVYSLFCISVFPFAFFLGKAKWVWMLRKIMANIGQISVLFTRKIYQEYK